MPSVPARGCGEARRLAGPDLGIRNVIKAKSGSMTFPNEPGTNPPRYPRIDPYARRAVAWVVATIVTFVLIGGAILFAAAPQ